MLSDDLFRGRGWGGADAVEGVVSVDCCQDAVLCSKQALNNLLGQLQRAGYLKRKAHPDDGRARIVQLTARGRRLDAAIWQAAREVERGWTDQIGDPDWGVFRRVLDQIAEANPAGPESDDE